MNLQVISFTDNGAALCRQLVDLCQQKGCTCQGYTIPRLATKHNLVAVASLDDWTKEAFAAKAKGQCDGLVFIGASGIAVRAIAPYLVSKAQDPAIITVDEQGSFVVSLVAGHIGGANDLAIFIADLLKATPVISTATDKNQCFAVDSWAVKNKMLIKDLDLIKVISGSLLAGEPIGFWSDFIVCGDLPKGLVVSDKVACGICLSYNKNKKPFATTLNLIPQRLHLGIGCRRGTSKEQIAKAVKVALDQQQISLSALCQVASIDIKQDEVGLLEFCQDLKLPCKFYQAAELQQAKGEFTPSQFVASITGVDNVCERAAVLSSSGSLIIKKQVLDGVTVGLAAEPWEVRFGY